jgi:NAD(P)-dependent dehydrogenase (short-subunit alcohol dehydrogenase family)
VDQHFSGKVALVTGGGSGIGRASCQAFAKVGARVVVADLDLDGGEETAQMIRSAGGEETVVQVDVTRTADVEALVAQTVAAYGRLGYAHNNAGILGPLVPLHEYPDDAWDRVLAVNLTGVFLCLKHEVRLMRGQGHGAIVNTASLTGLRGAPHLPGYGASKHGVVGLTRAAATAYAKDGIRVNAVCPGYIETPMLERTRHAAPDRAKFEARVAAFEPMGVGTPEEVAAVVVWLCSEAASHVTGVALPVDGGALA